jgi:hypothetical protein
LIDKRHFESSERWSGTAGARILDVDALPALVGSWIISPICMTPDPLPISPVEHHGNLFDHVVSGVLVNRWAMLQSFVPTGLKIYIVKLSICSSISGTCGKLVQLRVISRCLTYKNSLSFDQTGLSGSSSTSCTSNIFPAVFMNGRSALLLLLKQK